ncbi:MAG: DNA-directed RNA polymerase subunit B'' [Candidatus Nanoarchaeia archaeon]|jgi:DNA-directed RNA polymerase beta subunit
MISKKLLKAYHKDRLTNQFNLDSFNKFINEGMQLVIDEVGNVLPDILPSNVRDFEIKFGKVWIEKPCIVESDGTRREIIPMEARLRDITYESPILLEMYYLKNGVKSEKQIINIGHIPIMVKGSACTLNGLKRDELIEKKEDPDDPGGYFIINGTERAIVIIEDLAPNRMFVERKATGKYTEICKVFSEDAQLRIPHVVQKDKSGMITVSFTRMKNISFTLLMKALGICSDKDIVKAINPTEKMMSELYTNLYETASIKDHADALSTIGKKIGGSKREEINVEKAIRMMDKYLFPHIGHEESDRLRKAYYLANMVKKLLKLSYGLVEEDDKDHYSNKRLRLCGDMMEGLFRYSFRILASDMKYNFERLVKRGKLPGLQAITRRQLLTSRIKSSLATGEWVGGRHGVSQHLQRNNFVATISHLKRVVSSLSSARENFEARDLHPTQWGKLCASETPEGQNVGLRKTLAITCEISTQVNNDDNDNIIKSISELGVKVIK